MPVKTDDDSLNAYAKEICDALKANKVRVDLDDRSEKLGYRMREGQIQKVPYLLVVGFNEKDERTVSFRLHGEKRLLFFHSMSLLRNLTLRLRANSEHISGCRNN